MSETREARAAAARSRRAWLPPRWFVVLFWHGHRALLRVTRGRLGLWRPKPDRWGALRLTTTGRRTGRPRQVVVGYVEDGRNLITMAMNGWGAAEIDKNLDAYAARRPAETAVVVLEPADTAGGRTRAGPAGRGFAGRRRAMRSRDVRATTAGVLFIAATAVQPSFSWPSRLLTGFSRQQGTIGSAG